MKNIIDNQIQPRFNAINAVISSSKCVLTNISGRANKILEIHKKSTKVYFEKLGENANEQYQENKNFFK